ncbi:MAG: STAS domain-containing protein [Lachnospiraceae bacterium]|nr:STAS domain-containing protein [Lachnospiraceae bacterium]
MEVAFGIKSNVLVVRLTGDIDHHSCEHARYRTDKEFIERRLRDMEIDLSGVTFMDSSALGFVMGRLRLVKSLGGCLLVTGVKKEFSKMIKLSGLERVVDISYGEE